MLRTAAIALWLAAGSVALAAPKIGFVRISEIHEQLESSKIIESEIEAERKQVYTDARLDAYRSVLKELEGVREKLANLKGGDSQRAALERTFVVKRQEALVLQREYEEFRQRRLKEINAELVRRTEESLANIHLKAIEVAKANGFDLVFDTSGNTNTGLPFVLYSKDQPDITSDVLTALGETSAETAAGGDR